MLCLIVRSISPEHLTLAACYPEEDWQFCYRRALALIKRMSSEPEYPRRGEACVGVMRIPDNLPERIEQHKFKCAEITFHAIRFATRVEVPVAPICVKSCLDDQTGKTSPLKIDIRYSCLEALPEVLRAIVPDKRIDPSENPELLHADCLSALDPA